MNSPAPAKALRVLFVTPMYPSEADAVQGLFVRELAEALAAAGVDIRVAHVRNDLVWPFSMLKPRRACAAGPAASGTVPVMRHAVRGLPAALGESRYARKLGAGLREALARTWPDFRPDIVHAHSIIPGALAAESVAAAFGCPLFATVHGADVRLWLKPARTRRAILEAIRRGLRVVCVSEPLKQALVEAGAPPDSLQVVPNGMDLAKVHSGPNPLAARHAGKTVVLGVGNLKPEKGFDVFIAALAQVRKTVPGIQGVIVGGGPERRRLERLARQLKVADCLELVGAKTPAETMQYMDLCALFCLPSWSEGFGVAYLEAMAHGKPVIAVAGQGIAAIVRDSGAGALVPPRDVPATAAALQRLLENPEERQALGARGRRLAVEQFSWACCAREMIGLYRGTAAPAPRPAGLRIAHVDFTVDESVDRKLARLADAAREQKVPLEVVVFSLTAPPGTAENLFVHRLPGSGLGPALAAKFQWPFRLRRAAQVLAGRGYDAVILRYPKLPVGWRGFLRRVGVPVIVEHHSDETEELRGDGGLWRRLAAALDAGMQKRFLRNVAGVIGVTPEITARVHALAPQARAATITNGVDVADTPFTGFAPFDGKILRLVAVAAHFADWHGTDRLLRGILEYTGGCRIELVLLGRVPESQRRLAAVCARKDGVTVNGPGPVYGEASSPFYSAANLAVASLGLHRKGLRQASPLKVREYVARGIPFVYGYADPDLPEPCEFALRVPADDQPVDLEAVIQFAARTAGQPDLSARMRQFAQGRLDWRRKVEAMRDFVRRVGGVAP